MDERLRFVARLLAGEKMGLSVRGVRDLAEDRLREQASRSLCYWSARVKKKARVAFRSFDHNEQVRIPSSSPQRVANFGHGKRLTYHVYWPRLNPPLCS
jgi:hypothetical protein